MLVLGPEAAVVQQLRIIYPGPCGSVGTNQRCDVASSSISADNDSTDGTVKDGA